MVRLLSVLKSRTKFSTTDGMLKNWLNCTEVTVQSILDHMNHHHYWRDLRTLAKGDVVGEALC